MDFRVLLSKLSCLFRSFRNIQFWTHDVPSCVHLCSGHTLSSLQDLKLGYLGKQLLCNQQNFVRSCPDFPAFTRLSCIHVQTFVCLPDFRALKSFVVSPDFWAVIRFCVFMSRLSFVHQTFLRSISDFHELTILSCVQQTFVRLRPDFRVFPRLSCNHVQISLCSQKFRAFNGFSSVNVRASKRSPKIRAFNGFCAFLSSLSFVFRDFQTM